MAVSAHSRGLAFVDVLQEKGSVRVVWIWIIIAIIVIALIVWWLLSHRKGSEGSRGSAPVGRHVAASERGTAATAAGAAAGPEAADVPGDQPVFDQEAHDDTASLQDTGADEPGTTTTDAAPADGASAADVAGAAEGAAVSANPDAPEPVVHNTGSTGEEQLVASGSAAADSDVADRAATDARIAAENDDPAVRPAGAPPESAAAAAHHEDAEFVSTPVEQPVEGEVEPHDAGEPDDLGAPAAAEEEAADLGRPSDAEESEGSQEGPASASAGQTAGYAVDRADSSAGDAATSGVDPMTERFGAGAVSPTADGSAPAGHPIKGNADSMLFHTPDSPRYDATNPAVWFTDEAAATSAGFAHWDRTKRGGAIPAPAEAPEPAGAPQPAAAQIPAEQPLTVENGADGATGTSTADSSVNGQAATPEATAGDEGDGADAEATSERDPMTEQFGEGAASPREDGSAPSERHTIKGNADSMLFHTPDSPHYERVEAEVWFTDEEAARAAGFKHWDHRRR